jgi:hypothetical protein
MGHVVFPPIHVVAKKTRDYFFPEFLVNIIFQSPHFSKYVWTCLAESLPLKALFYSFLGWGETESTWCVGH